jgi:carboxylesterase
LPGHGTSVEDMSTRTWQEWTGEAERGLAELSRTCDQVFVTGLSMGGTITLYLAEQHPEKIGGIMPINAPVAKLNPLLPITLMNQYVLKKMTIPGVGSDIKDPNMKEMAYEKVPARAAAQLYKLMKITKTGLPSIKTPILVFESREDHVVPPMNGQYVTDNVASADKELVWLANSYHVATLDNDKDEIINRCIGFIKRLAPTNSEDAKASILQD